MRLSVFTPKSSQQLFIDLQKLYQGYLEEQELSITSLESLISDPESIFFVTLFNARHLGAVQVTIGNNTAILSLFCVRDITRRRGVGKNLLREVEKQLKNKSINTIQLSLADIKNDEQKVMIKFMTNSGYQLFDSKLIKAL